MTTLRAFEEVWICLMLVATLLAQAHTTVLTPDQVDLLHQLRARLQAHGHTVAGALAATTDIDALLAALEEGERHA